MTINKTVEMCRASAKTQLVKSVLASTKFDEPKEVLAKYIVEVTGENKEAKEAQVLKYNSYTNRGRGNGRGNFRGSNGYNIGYRSYNQQNFNRNNQNFNQNRSGRGRGNFRGARGNFGGSYRNQNHSNDRFVRLVAPENLIAPRQERGSDRNASTDIALTRVFSMGYMNH